MSSRELAIILWILIVLIYIDVINSDNGRFDIFISFMKLVIQPLTIIAFLYEVCLLYFFYQMIQTYNLSIWIIKDYLEIFIFTIFTFLIGVKTKTFILALLHSIGMGALLNFLISTYTFPFLIEMLILPILVFILVTFYTAKLQKLTDVKKVVNVLLTLIFAIIILYVAFNFINNFKSTSELDFWQGFVVEPIAWIINIPLFMLFYPLLQYDEIDNYTEGVKFASVLIHALTFWVLRIINAHLLPNNNKYS